VREIPTPSGHDTAPDLISLQPVPLQDVLIACPAVSNARLSIEANEVQCRSGNVT
jgi:hypothetical protein